MSVKRNGDLIKDIPDGKLLKKEEKGDLIVSEGPKGNPLWKNKKKLNENETENNTLNE